MSAPWCHAVVSQVEIKEKSPKEMAAPPLPSHKKKKKETFPQNPDLGDGVDMHLPPTARALADPDLALQFYPWEILTFNCSRCTPSTLTPSVYAEYLRGRCVRGDALTTARSRQRRRSYPRGRWSPSKGRASLRASLPSWGRSRCTST